VAQFQSRRQSLCMLPLTPHPCAICINTSPAKEPLVSVRISQRRRTLFPMYCSCSTSYFARATPTAEVPVSRPIPAVPVTIFLLKDTQFTRSNRASHQMSVRTFPPMSVIETSQVVLPLLLAAVVASLLRLHCDVLW